MGKILLVEDEMTEAKMLEYVLAKNDHSVVCVVNGEEALKALAKHNNIDLIISDINMDKMTGIELKKHINKDEKLKRIPFIFLTSIVDDHTEDQCRDLGCSLYLLKPFVKFDIAKKVAQVLSLKSFNTY